MEHLMTVMPGARRALFAKYHIGGCASCGFSPEETIATVCQRNGDIPPAEAISFLEESAARDAAMQMSVTALDSLIKAGRPPRLIDVRTREEHEAVALAGSELMTQDLLQTLFGTDKSALLVCYCHHGVRSMDAAAYLAGHGFTNVKSLSGGIDAWSCEIDTSVPRYALE